MPSPYQIQLLAEIAQLRLENEQLRYIISIGNLVQRSQDHWGPLVAETLFPCSTCNAESWLFCSCLRTGTLPTATPQTLLDLKEAHATARKLVANALPIPKRR